MAHSIVARVVQNRLISELGSGGTGQVYRAVLDGECDFVLDGEFVKGNQLSRIGVT
jgi:hypothetical protein